MTRPSTPVGDNGRGHLHDGLPVWICHVGHQDLALVEGCYLADILNNVGLPLTNLFSNCLSSGQHLSLFKELVGLHVVGGALGVHCLRPCLDDEKLSCPNLFSVTVLGPFDIHCLAIVLFYDTCPVGKLEYLIIREHIGMALFRSSLYVLDRLLGIIRIDHLELLKT